MNRLWRDYFCKFNPKARDIFSFPRRKVRISLPKSTDCAPRWDLQDTKIPSQVLGWRARTGAGEKPGRAFFFFFLPPLRQSHPGNLTFRTAGQSVSPRKPFPGENQSVEPSKLPDKAASGPTASGGAANARHFLRAASSATFRWSLLSPFIASSRRFSTASKRQTAQRSLPHPTVTTVTGVAGSQGFQFLVFFL